MLNLHDINFTYRTISNNNSQLFKKHIIYNEKNIQSVINKLLNIFALEEFDVSKKIPAKKIKAQLIGLLEGLCKQYPRIFISVYTLHTRNDRRFEVIIVNSNLTDAMDIA